MKEIHLSGIAVEQRNEELGAGEVRRDLPEVDGIDPFVSFDGDVLHTLS
jgi:hypothetical protein